MWLEYGVFVIMKIFIECKRRMYYHQLMFYPSSGRKIYDQIKQSLFLFQKREEIGFNHLVYCCGEQVK